MPGNTIEITDPRLGGAGPKVSINLPFTANAHKRRTYASGIVVLFFGAASILGLFMIPAAFLKMPFPLSLGLAVALLALVALGGAVCTMYAVALRDLNLPQPLISIDDDGVLDRRIADTPILWSEIARIVSRTKVNGGILLELKAPRPVRFTPFRVGAIFHQWVAPPQGAYIAMNGLFGPKFPEVIVYAFAHRHGIPVFEHRTLGGLKQINPNP